MAERWTNPTTLRGAIDVDHDGWDLPPDALTTFVVVAEREDDGWRLAELQALHPT